MENADLRWELWQAIGLRSGYLDSVYTTSNCTDDDAKPSGLAASSIPDYHHIHAIADALAAARSSSAKIPANVAREVVNFGRFDLPHLAAQRFRHPGACPWAQ